MNFLDFSSYDLDTWTTYFQENWFVIVIALAILLIIVKVVKTMVKWAISAVIVIGLILYSGYTLDDVKNLSTQVMSTSIEDLKEIGSKVADTVKDEALQAMLKESQNAKYTLNGDGTYTIQTESITLTGELEGKEVSISVKGAPAFKVEINDTISAFVEQAKNNSK